MPSTCWYRTSTAHSACLCVEADTGRSLARWLKTRATSAPPRSRGRRWPWKPMNRLAHTGRNVAPFVSLNDGSESAAGADPAGGVGAGTRAGRVWRSDSFCIDMRSSRVSRCAQCFGNARVDGRPVDDPVIRLGCPPAGVHEIKLSALN
jgi:hypothetical protein